jgi:hypothetical protein
MVRMVSPVRFRRGAPQTADQHKRWSVVVSGWFDRAA